MTATSDTERTRSLDEEHFTLDRGRRAVDNVRAWLLARPPHVAAFFFGMLLQSYILIEFASRHWFVGDDWDFLFLRGVVPEQSRGIWAPHNSHISVLPVVVYRALFEVFGLRSYLPYALVTIGFHIGISLLLFLLLRRCGASPWIAVASSWLILFMGAGGDALLVAAAMNHLGSLVVALAAVWAMLRWEFAPRALLAASALSLGSVLFSNTGVSAVCFVALVAVIFRGPTVALRVAAPPAATFVAWYLIAGRTSGASQFPTNPWDYLKAPALVWQGLSSALGNAVGVKELGPPLLIALLVAAVLAKGVDARLRNLMWAGILTAIFQSALLGLSRQWLDPGTGRYSYFTLIFLLPTVAAAFSSLSHIAIEPEWVKRLLVGGLLLGYSITGTLALRGFDESWMFLGSPWPGRVAGMVAVIDSGEKVLSPYGGDPFNADINPDVIDHPTILSALPARLATQQERIEAETAYATVVGADAPTLDSPNGIHEFEGSFTKPLANKGGCQARTAKSQSPVIITGSGDGSSFTVESTSTEVKTQLVRGDISSGARAWPVAPGVVRVSTSAKDALVFVTFNGAGTYTICS